MILAWCAVLLWVLGFLALCLIVVAQLLYYALVILCAWIARAFRCVGPKQ